MKKNSDGFTLIEVLIALAILGIAIIAIIRSTSQNVRGTAYLQDKTIAMWVGTEVVNRARLGLLKLPSEPMSQKTKMLNRTWPWEASMENTPNQKIKKIDVKVYELANHSKLIELESFVYVGE